MVKIRSYPVQNCTKGRVNKSSNVYLGCRENSKDILVKLSWKSNRDPKVLWKKVIPSAVMTMEIIGDYLFVGLKNGSLQLWDIQKDECIKKIKLFSSTFSVSTVKGENITLASRDGYVAMISKNGKIQWKNKITHDKIVGIYEDKDYILVINTIGEQFHIKFKSGKIIRHRYKNLELGRNAGLSSSIIKYRERFVITGYGGIWTFRHRNSNNSIHQYMSDPLMRIIHQHPFGFYSGDDADCVCFWSLGDIKIEVENYKPPLQNSEEYYELLKSERRSKMKDYEEFMVYRLERTGAHTKLNIAPEELQNYLNPEQVLIIIRNDLERIFIWKGVNSHIRRKGVNSPVREKFIAARVDADLQRDLFVNGLYHRCKIISVDQGDEPTEFLKAFGLDSMEATEPPPDEEASEKSDGEDDGDLKKNF